MASRKVNNLWDKYRNEGRVLQPENKLFAVVKSVIIVY